MYFRKRLATIWHRISLHFREAYPEISWLLTWLPPNLPAQYSWSSHTPSKSSLSISDHEFKASILFIRGFWCLFFRIITVIIEWELDRYRSSAVRWFLSFGILFRYGIKIPTLNVIIWASRSCDLPVMINLISSVMTQSQSLYTEQFIMSPHNAG